jgi:uncharacterized protein (DUF1800 family)
MSNLNEAALALSRFGMGAKPGDVRRIASDPRGALLEQVANPALALIQGLPPSPEQLRIFNALRVDQQRLIEEAARAQAGARAALEEAERATRRASDTSLALRGPIQPIAAIAPPPRNPANTPQPTASTAQPAAPASGAPAAGPMGNMMGAGNLPGPEEPPRRALFLPEMEARFGKMIGSDAGLTERLAAFWGNHFATSIRKGGQMMVMIPGMERDVIRPNIYGRFEDMLLGVTRHPAMLYYLDANQSFGPNSVQGKRRNRGLNENLAREIMELHTLGVDGGYSQADVTAFAKVLTGWSFYWQTEALGGNFVFWGGNHEPGPKTILGKTYAEAGEAEAVAVLRDLANHPSTARFISRKLAAHFVADDPPPALVERLRRAFLDSRGDLAFVTRALLNAPEAWSAAQTKLRTPTEFVVAALRATAAPLPAQNILGILNNLGQPVLAPPSPKGFADDAATWLAPDAIKTRLDWVSAFSSRFGDRLDPVAIANDVLGGRITDETLTTVRRAETRPQAIALLLMSPEFQRR